MAKAGKAGADTGVTGMARGRQLRTPVADNNNVRNWRLFRGIATQESLANLTAACDPDGKGISRVVILKLENGEQRYNEAQITLLARALSVAPRDLIGTNPYDAGDIFAVYAGLPDPAKRRMLKLARALRLTPKRP